MIQKKTGRRSVQTYKVSRARVGDRWNGSHGGLTGVWRGASTSSLPHLAGWFEQHRWGASPAAAAPPAPPAAPAAPAPTETPPVELSLPRLAIPAQGRPLTAPAISGRGPTPWPSQHLTRSAGIWLRRWADSIAEIGLAWRPARRLASRPRCPYDAVEA